jgi:RND family efflux transporter MFP subunit
MADAAMTDVVADLRIDRDRPRRRRRRWWYALGALAALLVLALVLHLANRPPSVAVAQVRLSRPGESATSLTASGYVASDRRSILAPKIPGRLDQLLVQEGQKVNKGDVIAKLDDADAQVGVERAIAFESQAVAQRAQAQARRVQADQQLARAQRLFQSGVIARSGLDDAQAESRAAIANERAATANVHAAQRQVALAKLQLQYTVVRAPFTGTVARKLADEGAVLAPAAIDQPDVGGIVELVDLSALEVDAEVSEDQLRKVRLGQSALVTLDAFPDQVFRAHVARIRPAIDRSKGTAVIKVVFDEPPAHALPDMTAKVAFLEHPVDQAALAPKKRVPASAVAKRNGQDVLWVVENGRARPLPVRILQRSGDEVELAEGPPPGAQVIVSPESDLSPGQAVRVQS